MSLTKDVDSERQNSIRIPITISWEGIKYSVVEKKGPPCKAKKRNKKILHGVSGITRPGQLLAIMGSTGAGKSSLLDVLAQRYHFITSASPVSSLIIYQLQFTVKVKEMLRERS